MARNARIEMFLCGFISRRVYSSKDAMSEENQLLRQYAQEQDEAAFAEVVYRHLNLVYSTALRWVRNVEMAKDITQVVFVDLAKNSRSLSAEVVLSGWLYRHTSFVSSKALRTELRRRRREEQMMSAQDIAAVQPSRPEELGQILDEAIQRLKPEDRDAVVLRFLQENSLAEVGKAFGINENAARMRIDRALEKLRLVLSRRGVTSSSASVAAVLGGLTTPAPTGLAAAVTTSALASTATASGIGLGIIHTMNTTKITAGLGAVVLAAGITVPVLMQQKIAQLQRDNSELRGQGDEVAELRGEVERLSGIKVDSNELERLRSERGELVRLRGEVGLLRQRLRDVQNSQTQQHSVQSGADEINANPTAQGDPVKPGYYDASSWADSGFSSPQNSTLTFLWSLRHGHAQQYSDSLGKTNLQSLPIEWAHALGKVKGSQISETMTSADGGLMVGILHELADGSTENSWLGFHNVDGKWLVRRITGYPIKVWAAQAPRP